MDSPREFTHNLVLSSGRIPRLPWVSSLIQAGPVMDLVLKTSELSNANRIYYKHFWKSQYFWVDMQEFTQGELEVNATMDNFASGTLLTSGKLFGASPSWKH